MSEHEDQAPDSWTPSGDEQQNTSPRMVEFRQAAEEDGMEVDIAEEKETHLEERARHMKRGRENGDSHPDTHSEPKFKRQRTHTPTSTDRMEADPGSSSSSSSSSTTSVSSIPASTASAPGLSLIRQSLDDTEAAEIFWTRGFVDIDKARGILFGEAADRWPAGFCLMAIAGLSPELEHVLTDCGVYVLWKDSLETKVHNSLALVVPESDRESLSLKLLQMDTNEPAPDTLEAGESVLGNDANDHQIAMAIAFGDDDEDTSTDDNDEFRRFQVSPHSTPLMIAAALGDTDFLRKLLSNGADPNQRDPKGNTALMIASSHGHHQIVRVLIHDPRTQASLKNTRGSDALSVAAEAGHRDVVYLLLYFSNIATEMQVSPETDTHPLLLAASNGHHEICKLILRKGVDIDLDDPDGWTALWFAANGGHVECCKYLLGAGADVTHINAAGKSLPYLAVSKGNLELLDMLVEHGAALTSSELHTPLLICAVEQARATMVKRLIELKVDINAIGPENQTALTVACQLNSMSTARLLLEASANPDIPDIKGWNSLVYAAGVGNIELLSLLIESGAQLRSRGNFGYLALYEATRNAKPDAMKFLLSKNAPTTVPKVRQMHSSNTFPLISLPMCSSEYSRNLGLAINAIQLLIQHGTPLNEVDGHGHDALMLAVLVRVPQFVQILFNAGMRVGQKNLNDYDALQLAAQQVDEVLTETPGPIPESGRVAVITLWTIVECAKRQPNLYLLTDSAAHKAWHPITREILCQAQLDPNQPFGSGLGLDYLLMWGGTIENIMQSACLDSGGDWDRTATEIRLCTAGTPVPAINVYCAYIDAFPAMKLQLFGPGRAAEIPQHYWDVFFYGVTATMETMIVAEHAIEDAYADLAWAPGREILTSVARKKISDAVIVSIEREQSLGTAFANLFEECLQSTLSTHSVKKLDLHAAPTPGIIAGNLMGMGIYTALAKEIEKAWHTAWIETIKPAPAAPSSSSSSSHTSLVDSGTFFTSFNDRLSTWHSPESDRLAEIDVHTLSEQQSTLLLQAFRKVLATSVNSGAILRLENASPEVSGLYADLMYRQLHMLAQFINWTEPEVEVQAVPAPASASVNESMPDTAPGFYYDDNFDFDFDPEI